MLQALLEEPRKIVIRDIPKPLLGNGQIMIKVMKIGICGSDIHAYYGKHPFISCPIVQGHEFSGEVVEIGSSTKKFDRGDRITIMPQLVCGNCYQCKNGNYHICDSLKVIGCNVNGAAQEYFCVDEKLAIKLPESISYEYGALIEPLAVSVHSLRRLKSVEGKKIVILGAGTIGNLTAQVARQLYAKSIIVTDVVDFRLDVAKRCHIEIAVNVSREDLKHVLNQSFGKDRADAIIECVGSQETVEQALSLSRKGTEVVLAGVFGQKALIDVALIQDKELVIIGTLMYQERDYRDAIRMIESGQVDLSPLITNRFSLKEYDVAYRHIEQHRDSTMKVLIDLER
jgi:L-iditol 2-dehydrogenase